MSQININLDLPDPITDSDAYYDEHYGGEIPDSCCPECMHDCYGEKPKRYCLECDWKESR